MLFLGGNAQPQPYSTFGINKQENVKSLKRLIGSMRMQRKLSVGVLFKANGEFGKPLSVGVFVCSVPVVDSHALALKRMWFVVFLLRPFPLGGAVAYDIRFPVYLSQRWTPFPIYFPILLTANPEKRYVSVDGVNVIVLGGCCFPVSWRTCF